MKKVTLIYPEEKDEHTLIVTLDLDECLKKLHHEITYDGDLLDRYEVDGGQGRRVVVSIYERYYIRAGNRLTVTLTMDNFTGKTRVHWRSGGGSDSVLFNFDWGAADHFDGLIKKTLSPYIDITEKGSRKE